MKDYQDKVAVVTGGASGVGKSLCEVFARQGMKVVVADIEQSALDLTVSDLAAIGGEFVGLRADVTDPDSMSSLADTVFGKFGNVHVLCNNAGVGVKEAARRIWTLTPNDWEWAYRVNVMGVANGIRAFVPRMLEHGEEGHVVNTTSGNGGCYSFPTTPIYASSKAAVTSLTEVLNYQFLMDGAALQAHLLFPGPHMVNTKILASQRNRHEALRDEKEVADYLSMEDLKNAAVGSNKEFKLTEPAEVAESCLEGLNKGDFWIRPYTDEHQAAISRRYADLLNNENPQLTM